MFHPTEIGRLSVLKLDSSHQRTSLIFHHCHGPVYLFPLSIGDLSVFLPSENWSAYGFFIDNEALPDAFLFSLWCHEPPLDPFVLVPREVQVPPDVGSATASGANVVPSPFF